MTSATKYDADPDTEDEDGAGFDANACSTATDGYRCTIADMPGRRCHSSVRLGHYMLVFGGITEGGARASDECLVVDLDTYIWMKTDADVRPPSRIAFNMVTTNNGRVFKPRT